MPRNERTERNDPEKPKTFFIDGKLVQVEEEIPATGERIRYQIIYGATSKKSGDDKLTEKERKDLEKFYRLVELASIYYGKQLKPTQKGITRLVKNMIDTIMQGLYEKGSVSIEIK